MEDLTFKMESIVRAKDDLEDFEGPLTLLLHLLSKNKVEIQDIRISDILEQYLAYLQTMKEMDLEIASSFVQMASHLLYIKTKTLLHEEEEIPELELLKTSMEELQRRDLYRQIKAMMCDFLKMSLIGAGYIEKPPESIKANNEYRYVHIPADLLEALARILDISQDVLEQPAVSGFIMPTPIVYSVTDKARELVDQLKNVGEVTVNSLLHESRSRSEVVATFIAILELCKMGSILFSGEGAACSVSYTGVERTAIAESGGE